jgi:hypothetical protein
MKSSDEYLHALGSETRFEEGRREKLSVLSRVPL